MTVSNMQCPLVSDYQFCTHCTIKSCVNYTPRTKNRCLSLDVRPSADSPITDSELLHYKFPDKELSVKDVTRIRKRAEDRVHQWIIFHKVVTFINEQCVVRSIKVNETISDLAKTKPFCLSEFNFKPWHLLYLVDSKFCNTVVPIFSFKELLGYVQTDYEDFCNEIKSLECEEIPCKLHK
jgi:hypothetical protein